MATIDIIIILAFIAYAISSGLSSKDVAGESLDEYFLAGRSLPGWKAGLSMAATQFAADTPLMVTGLVATGRRLLTVATVDLRSCVSLYGLCARQ